jgi:hypothetical protein
VEEVGRGLLDEGADRLRAPQGWQAGDVQALPVGVRRADVADDLVCADDEQVSLDRAHR